MATTDQLTAWLAEAEQAQHDLAIGGKAVSISSSSGKSVSFTASDAARLDAHVQSLRRQLGLSTVAPVRPVLG
jgi:hypothetical protein